MTANTEEGFEPKDARLRDPSGWLKLTRYETVRLLIDTLLESPPGYTFNKSELARRSGVSRESIREHIPLLLELGILTEDTSGEWTTYRLNDEGKVTTELFELQSALGSVLSGESKNIHETTIRSEFTDRKSRSGFNDSTIKEGTPDVDNSRRESNGGDSLHETPSSLRGMTNAD